MEPMAVGTSLPGAPVSEKITGFVDTLGILKNPRNSWRQETVQKTSVYPSMEVFVDVEQNVKSLFHTGS